MDTKEIEARVAKARELHDKGMNCCQAVVMAYADKLPVDNDTAMKMASAMGRGMSGLRETCGCVTGMAMVCGLCDQTMMVKGLGNRFREENGELNCYKLLQLQGKDHSCNDLVDELLRTDYVMLSYCTVQLYNCGNGFINRALLELCYDPDEIQAVRDSLSRTALGDNIDSQKAIDELIDKNLEQYFPALAESHPSKRCSRLAAVATKRP